MNTPALQGLNPNRIGAQALKQASQDAFDAVVNTPSYQVPTYQLRLQAQQAADNFESVAGSAKDAGLVKKLAKFAKNNKLAAAAINLVLVAGVALGAKKCIDNKNQAPKA